MINYKLKSALAVFLLIFLFVALFNFDTIVWLFYVGGTLGFKKTVFDILSYGIENLRDISVLLGTAFDELYSILIG